MERRGKARKNRRTISKTNSTTINSRFYYENDFWILFENDIRGRENCFPEAKPMNITLMTFCSTTYSLSSSYDSIGFSTLAGEAVAARNKGRSSLRCFPLHRLVRHRAEISRSASLATGIVEGSLINVGSVCYKHAHTHTHAHTHIHTCYKIFFSEKMYLSTGTQRYSITM